MQQAQGEISVVHNGKQVFYDVKISPLRNRKGKLNGQIVILRDITQRVLAQVQVQEALKNVQQLKEQLYKNSIHDALTGMYNRRYLDEVLPREIANAERSHSPISFVMMDIDHFKTINDTYGHAAGDMVLQKLSEFFKKHIRVGDLIFRYGGEEFLALLINTTIESALHFAERWQQSLPECCINIDGKEIKITISMGIAEFKKHGITSEEVLHAADRALYQAKSQGRNCITLWDVDQ
ncbi:MAG: diguanylate cyclase [Anaerolineaceae bacterium]|nr:diguanylate cyclase [Anaerolineaceae bacterium]